MRSPAQCKTDAAQQDRLQEDDGDDGQRLARDELRGAEGGGEQQLRSAGAALLGQRADPYRA